jgi:uncharacterized membrane protein YczE
LTSRDRRLPRRLAQLYAGLVLYGVSMALMVRSSLGVMPWDVLHQGLSRQLGWSLGLVTIVIGALVLLAWIPLRERPGLGTLSNVVVVGLAVDAALAVLPAPGGLAGRAAFGASGILLNGGGPVGLVRTAIEVVVVATGWLLGGTLGVVTVLYALTIGPLVHMLLPRFAVAADDPAG